jgi:DNA-binding MarR family transcriptional regulator
MLQAVSTAYLSMGRPLSEDISLVRNRGSIRSLAEAIKRLRYLSPTMPVAEVHMFLVVSLNEGSSLGELAEIAEMKKSSASRYLLDLSDKTRAGGQGYGIVVREADPAELRKNQYSLSLKGKQLIAELINKAR